MAQFQPKRHTLKPIEAMQLAADVTLTINSSAPVQARKGDWLVQFPHSNITTVLSNTDFRAAYEPVDTSLDKKADPVNDVAPVGQIPPQLRDIMRRNGPTILPWPSNPNRGVMFEIKNAVGAGSPTFGGFTPLDPKGKAGVNPCPAHGPGPCPEPTLVSVEEILGDITQQGRLMTAFGPAFLVSNRAPYQPE